MSKIVNRLNSHIVLLGNLAEEHKFQEAYEIAELLFVETSYPFFFNACLSYKWQSNKWQTDIEGKDLFYLANASNVNQLSYFLRGICFTYFRNHSDAIKSFEDSLKNDKFSEKIPLYKLYYKNGKLTFNDYSNTIANVATHNLQTIIRIADLNSCNLIIKHYDSFMPYIDSNGNLSIVDTGDQDIPASIDKKKKIPALKKSRETLANDEPADQNIWIRKGDKWQVKYQGNEFYLDDHVGVRYIAYLLQNTNTAISCDTLSYLINAPPVDSILDEYSRMSIEELERENLTRLDGMGRPEDPENLLETINKFKAKYLRLGQALKRAQKSGSDNLARKLAVIREQIDDELREITNKYGLPRPELDDFDKARKRVSLRIQDVINKIRKKKYSKTLPDHLQLFIKKGRYCIYEPMEDTKWEVDF